MYMIRESLYLMEMCHVSEDPKEQGTGTWKVHGRYMEGTWKVHGRNLDDSGNTTRRGTGNRTTRTIRIRKYFEAGPDHIGKQGQVGSSLCRARVGLLWVLRFSGSRVLRFSGFSGV